MLLRLCLRFRSVKAVVFAGGASRRMGADKAMLTHVDGSTWLERQVRLLRSFDLEVCVMSGYAAHRRCLSGWPGVTVQAEPWSPAGPLRALSCLLSADETQALLTLPVDMPGLQVEALQMLMDAWQRNESRALVADDGLRLQPLLGIYPCSAFNRAALEAELSHGQARWLGWLQRIDHDTLKLPAEQVSNVNHPSDLAALVG